MELIKIMSLVNFCLHQIIQTEVESKDSMQMAIKYFTSVIQQLSKTNYPMVRFGNVTSFKTNSPMVTAGNFH